MRDLRYFARLAAAAALHCKTKRDWEFLVTVTNNPTTVLDDGWSPTTLARGAKALRAIGLVLACESCSDGRATWADKVITDALALSGQVREYTTTPRRKKRKTKRA